MSYADYKKRIGLDIMEVVSDIIKTEKLDTKSRAHYVAHQRFYLMHYLRVNTKLTLETIGGMFKRDHATVKYAINKHEEFIEYGDYEYLINIMAVKNYLEEKFNK